MFIKKGVTMRTTLSIDDDVLIAARGLAERQHKSVGEVISDLARQALQPRSPTGPARNGITLLASGPHARPVDLELVNQLRDELS
jgi:hypothetical protein